MKIKNLNFIEKHIEKVIISVALLFFALVIWLFVLGKPYTVEVSTRSGVSQVTPDEVEQMISDQARRLEQNIRKTDTPFEPIPLPSWTEDFRARMTGHFLPVNTLSTPLAHKGLDQKLVDNREKPIDPTRVVPTPPAPQVVAARADYGVLALPQDSQAAEQLVKLVGDLALPRDFRYVSVSAKFEMEQWRQRLKDDKLPVEQRIPEDWWRARMLLTDVLLERQELDPATGQWGQATVVPPLPGQEPAYRNWQLKLTTAEVPPLIESIRDGQDRIARPPFVNLERGTWTPPDAAVQLSEEQSQELMDIQNRLAQLRKRAGGDASASPDQAGGGTGVAAQIVELETRRDVLLGIVRPSSPAPGSAQPPPPTGHRPGFGPRRPGGPGGPPGEPIVIPALPDVKIWAHDLTAKPGRTYRYRVTVSVISPMYHIDNVTREQYTQYFNKLSLTSEASAWSDPVKVDPEVYYFLTAQDAGRKLATVEVLRIFNGLWVRKAFDVRAGDAIGDAITLPYSDQSVRVDLNTDAMVVDLAFPVPASLGASVDVNQTRMIVYDMAANRMTSRTLGGDLQDEVYQRLLREIQVRSAMASSN